MYTSKVSDRIESTPPRPVVEAFDDYRAYLRAMITYLKASRRHFSYRSFARKAGFSSPSFLKLVAEGKRNLTERSIAAFARGLELSDRERDVFEGLVLFGQAPSDAERNRHYARLKRLTRRARSESPQIRLEEAQYDVYLLWYALPIRELLLAADGDPDPDAIARRLHPRISAAEVGKALRLLERIGLVARDKTGRLRPVERSLVTSPGVRSLAIRNFHREMLRLAAASLDGVPVAERNVTSVTLSLTTEQYHALTERIAELRREAADLAEDPAACGDGPREIHLLSVQLFPLTRGEKTR